MKNIRKLKKTAKAAAGSALLVGATLTGAAGLAAAQDSGSDSMDLGDYPQPFVNDDGEVDSTIVVGSQGKQADVVGAINVAGSLGNSAYTTSEESVSVEGSFGWSASDGVSLDTRNSQLHFGDTIDEVRQTLTEDQLDVLQTQEVLSGDAEQDVEQYLYVGDQPVAFGNPGDTDGEEDPFLYVQNPANPSGVSDSGTYLYRLQANFQDGVSFEDSDGSKNDDVYGEEITLFGTDYTVADSALTNGDEQLVLYGSSQDVDVSNGESETVTVNEEEHTVETVAVTGSNSAAVRIDGSLEQVEEGDEFDVSGETLRVDNIINTGDNGAGVVQFAIGSEKVTLEHGEPVMMGSDDEEVDGTYVSLSGSNLDTAVGDDSTDDSVELSSIEIAVGADDSDNSYVRAGEAFEDPVFDDLQFHFGGLNPDAAEGEGDNVGEYQVSTDGDDVATASFSDGDNDATVNWAFRDSSNNLDLADGDDDKIVVQEAEEVYEDDYFTSDAGDFAHMWEVTSIDVEDGEEATVQMEDVVTGASVELVADNHAADSYDSGDYVGDQNEDYYGTEVIDGQTYHFKVDADDSARGDGAVQVVWGTGATNDPDDDDLYEGTINTGGNHGGTTEFYTALDTASGSSVSFMDELNLGATFSAGNPEIYELPSTESTDTQVVEVGTDGSGQYYLDVGNDETGTNGEVTNLDSSGDSATVEVGALNYRFTFDGSGLQTVAPAVVTTGSYDSSDYTISYVGDGTYNTGAEDDAADDTEVVAAVTDASADDNLQAVKVTSEGEALPTTSSSYQLSYRPDGGSWTTATGTVTLSNNDQTAKVGWSGSSVNLEAGDDVRVVVADNDYTDDTVKTTINPQSDPTQTYDSSGGTTTVDAVGPAVGLFEPENENDQEEAYFTTVSTNSDDEIQVDQPSFTGDTRTTDSLDSDDDVTAGYDLYGAHTMFDSDDQHSFTAHVPHGQATAGAAVTGAEGSLEASAGGAGTVETNTPTGWPDSATTDEQVDAEGASNLILVGGPAVNTLVEDLAEENKTWTADDYEEDTWVLDLVEGFSSDQHALVVAGYGSEDTRAASQYISNYADHAEELAGKTTKSMTTGQ